MIRAAGQGVNAVLTSIYASYRMLTNALSCQLGNVVIETALVVPLLVLLAIGTAEYGRAYSAKSELASVARAGAQAAIEFGADDESLNTTVRTNLIKAGLILNTNDQDFDGTKQPQTSVANYCRCPGGVPVGCDDSCSGDSLPRRYVEVTASLPFSMMVPMPMLGQSMTLSESVRMRME